MFDTKLCKNVVPNDILNELVADFENGCDQSLIHRRFNVKLERAKELMIPIIKKYLPGNWTIDGGNYFETNRPYRLHCDSGKELNKRLYYNIVIPIKLQADNYNPDLNKLIVTNQTWQGDAAFFIKGDVGQPEYNICVTDYSNVGNLAVGFDQYLLKSCSHLNLKNLEGFTTKAVIDWCPGDIILFRRDLIHVTSNWSKAGVVQKLGLSFLTSYNDPGST